MYHWQPWEHHKFQHITNQTEVDRLDILRACNAADDPRTPRFRADVQNLVSQGPLSIEQLQTKVFELACKHFPKRPPPEGGETLAGWYPHPLRRNHVGTLPRQIRYHS